MIIQATFGATQANLGYTFYGDDGLAIGSRITAGIVAGLETGSYIADATVPAGAVGVYWNDTVTLATATEDLREALASPDVPSVVEIREEMDSNSTQLAKLSVATITVVSPVAITGNAISGRAGDTWAIELAGLGSLADADDLVWTVKSKGDDADAAARILIDLDGLAVLNGAAHGTAADGSLTIDDDAAGDVTIAIKAPQTEAVGKFRNAIWAIKKITAGGVATTLATGKIRAEESVIDRNV